jgi:CBS domain-containing protein
MLDRHVSGLTVIDDDGKLAGLLTEGDLLKRSELGTAAASAHSDLVGDAAAREYIRSHSWRVGDVMTKYVVTVEETTPVDRLAVVMRANNIKRLPVMRGDSVIGIVSRADVLRALISAPRDNSARGDDALQRAVVTRLHMDLKLGPATVSVTVNDGNVHLSGHVASEIERKAALVATETVDGVRGVVNDLRLSEHPAMDRGQGAGG